MSPSLIEVLVFAVLALVCTFFLFEKMKSSFSGRLPLLGGTAVYGGSVGGFVLLFVILISFYARYAERNEQTPIRLAGSYNLVMHRADGVVRRGTAEIRQIRRTTYLDISGAVESEKTPPSVTFQSSGARLNGREIAFIYENSRDEMGIAVGHISDDHPNTFTLRYYDVAGSDYNLDLQGSLVFTRHK